MSHFRFAKTVLTVLLCCVGLLKSATGSSSYGYEDKISGNASLLAFIEVEPPFGPVAVPNRPVSGTDVNLYLAAAGVTLPDRGPWLTAELTSFKVFIGDQEIPAVAHLTGSSMAEIKVRFASNHFPSLSIQAVRLEAGFTLRGFDEHKRPTEEIVTLNPIITLQMWNRVTLLGTKFAKSGKPSTLYPGETLVALNGARNQFQLMQHDFVPTLDTTLQTKHDFLGHLHSPPQPGGEPVSSTVVFAYAHGTKLGLYEGAATNDLASPALIGFESLGTDDVGMREAIHAAVFGPSKLPRPNMMFFYLCGAFQADTALEPHPLTTLQMDFNGDTRNKAIVSFAEDVGLLLRKGDCNPNIPVTRLDSNLSAHSYRLLQLLAEGKTVGAAVDIANREFPPRAPVPLRFDRDTVAPLVLAQVKGDRRARMRFVYCADDKEEAALTAHQGTKDTWWFRTYWRN